MSMAYRRSLWIDAEDPTDTGVPVDTDYLDPPSTRSDAEVVVGHDDKLHRGADGNETVCPHWSNGDADTTDPTNFPRGTEASTSWQSSDDHDGKMNRLFGWQHGLGRRDGTGDHAGNRRRRLERETIIDTIVWTDFQKERARRVCQSCDNSHVGGFNGKFHGEANVARAIAYAAVVAYDDVSSAVTDIDADDFDLSDVALASIVRYGFGQARDRGLIDVF